MSWWDDIVSRVRGETPLTDEERLEVLKKTVETTEERLTSRKQELELRKKLAADRFELRKIDKVLKGSQRNTGFIIGAGIFALIVIILLARSC